jgi:hypothetical protein
MCICVCLLIGWWVCVFMFVCCLKMNDFKSCWKFDEWFDFVFLVSDKMIPLVTAAVLDHVEGRILSVSFHFDLLFYITTWYYLSTFFFHFLWCVMKNMSICFIWRVPSKHISLSLKQNPSKWNGWLPSMKRSQLSFRIILISLVCYVSFHFSLLYSLISQLSYHFFSISFFIVCLLICLRSDALWMLFICVSDKKQYRVTHGWEWITSRHIQK